MPNKKGGLKRYGHYSLKQADVAVKDGQRQRYKVTTINWTYATIRSETNLQMVHRNEYSFTLRNLIKFIRETEQVAEDIIAVELEQP